MTVTTLPEVQTMTQSAVAEVLRRWSFTERKDSMEREDSLDTGTERSSKVRPVDRSNTASKTAGFTMIVPAKKSKNSRASRLQRGGREAVLLLQLFPNGNKDSESGHAVTRVSLLDVGGARPRLLASSLYSDVRHSDTESPMQRTRRELQQYASRAGAGKEIWLDAILQLLEKAESDAPEFFAGSTSTVSLSERIRAQGPLADDPEFQSLGKVKQAQAQSRLRRFKQARAIEEQDAELLSRRSERQLAATVEQQSSQRVPLTIPSRRVSGRGTNHRQAQRTGYIAQENSALKEPPQVCDLSARVGPQGSQRAPLKILPQRGADGKSKRRDAEVIVLSEQEIFALEGLLEEAGQSFRYEDQAPAKMSCPDGKVPDVEKSVSAYTTSLRFGRETTESTIALMMRWNKAYLGTEVTVWDITGLDKPERLSSSIYALPWTGVTREKGTKTSFTAVKKELVETSVRDTSHKSWEQTVERLFGTARKDVPSMLPSKASMRRAQADSRGQTSLGKQAAPERCQ